MKTAIFISILVLWSGQGQDGEFDFTNYQEMRAHMVNLYNDGKYGEAARVLEWALERFPDNVMANAYNLALTYRQLEQFDKGIKTLKYALDRGAWFSIYAFEDELWDPLKEVDGFEEITKRNEELRREAQKTAKPKLLVVTPTGYEKNKKYPLFIALHGGGGNMNDFKDVWKSEKLEKEFITAFVQSSQVVAMNGYNWTEDIEVSKKEIYDAYNTVVAGYSVDIGEVIIGGFSSGGVAALEIALCNTIPVSGFVVLCPAKPESYNAENVAAAKERGLRGTLLTTEMDRRLSAQEEMANIMEETGLEHRFIITPDIGHWIPDDLNVKIDSSIDHIRNK